MPAVLPHPYSRHPHHSYHHHHHHHSLPSPQSSVASPPKRHKTMDGMSEDEFSFDDNEIPEQEQNGKRSPLEIKREKNRIKQRNLRERRAKHIAQLESTVAQLTAANRDTQSRLFAAESRANNLAAFAQELEGALVHRGFQHEVNAIRRTWAGVLASVPKSAASQPAEADVRRQEPSRDLLSTLATAASAASSVDPARPVAHRSYSPYGASWDVDNKSTGPDGGSRWYNPSPVTGEKRRRYDENTAFKTPPTYHQLPSLKDVDVRQPMPMRDSFGSPYLAKLSKSSEATEPAHQPRYQPVPPSLNLSPLNNATSPSRLSIAELLSPVPEDGPSAGIASGSTPDASWPWNKAEPIVSSASSSLSSLVRAGPTPQSQTPSSLPQLSQVSQFPQFQPQLQLQPNLYSNSNVNQNRQQSLSEMSVIDAYLGAPAASELDRLPMAITPSAAPIIPRRSIPSDPHAASLQAARRVISAYLPHPMSDVIPDLPEITQPNEQHSILLALSHLPDPSVAAHWQSTQLSALPPADAKLLLEYQSSPYADPRVCLLPIAVLRAAVVKFLRRGLAIDITRLIATTLTQARVFGCTLDPDAWEMADEFWDEWEGWFPQGRAYCSSLSKWRRRDGHRGSKVAEMILGYEKGMCRREDAIGRPPGWRKPGSD